MIEGLNCWARRETNAGYRILSDTNVSDLGSEEAQVFVHVPYDDFSVPSRALDTFCKAKTFRMGVYLARVDLSDLRHVVFGFACKADRDVLLASEGVIVRKMKPKLQPWIKPETRHEPDDGSGMADF